MGESWEGEWRQKWSDEKLEALRRLGDRAADEVVTALMEQRDVGEVQRLLAQLVENDEPPSNELPRVVQDYFAEQIRFTESQQRDVDAGERFFALYGPEIMLVLCCGSLPFDYANERAVPVLFETGFLANRPNLRVAQTAQMIVDVMVPDGLDPEGRGVRSAQKVRLMHAAVRKMILEGKGSAWDVDRLGTPINQADLLYTLLSFTTVVLRGLRRLHLPYRQEHAESYYDTWRIVSQLMGLDPALVPQDLPEAEWLTDRMAERAHGTSHAGQVMTRALSGLVGDVLGPLAVFRFSLLRFFTGSGVATCLGIPRRPVLDEMVSLVSVLARGLDAVRGRSGGGRAAFRTLSLALIQLFIDQETGGRGRLFRVPTHLEAGWRDA